MKSLTTFAISVVAMGLICAGLGNTSCSSNSSGDDDDDDTVGDAGHTGLTCDGGTDDGGVSYSGQAGEPCPSTLAGGAVPDPQCDDAVQTGDPAGVESLCSTVTPGCDLSKCQVSTEAGSCEPLTTNPPDGPWGFRMRRLTVVAPVALAASFIQNSVVTNGIDMNEPQCGEIGTGAFSWLLKLDPTSGTIETGGAPPCDIPNGSNPPQTGAPTSPSCDPFNTGYCFVNKTIGSLKVQPATAQAHKNCDGSWATVPGAIGNLNVPIYYQGSIIVLPIRQGTMSGMQVSDNGNCVGSFNPGALNQDCSDKYKDCSKWKSDGSITGYITLEDADNVRVDLLHESLCVILTASAPVDAGGGYGVCARNADGSIQQPADPTYQGNYCSTTNSPTGCKDSVWLAATFAASAVKINDGKTSGADGGPNEDCLGLNTPGDDAGTTTEDSGTPVDASANNGSDAGVDASDASVN